MIIEAFLHAMHIKKSGYRRIFDGVFVCGISGGSESTARGGVLVFVSPGGPNENYPFMGTFDDDVAWPRAGQGIHERICGTAWFCMGCILMRRW